MKLVSKNNWIIMNRQADTLIIVGNGFDLANNFKTSYKDFVKHKLNSFDEFKETT